MRIVTVVGARPQFVKAAPVSRAMRGRCEEVLVHTGQHYDDAMSAVFFRGLGLPEPAHDLGVGSGGHGAQTGEMLRRLEPVLLAERPEAVLVYGDTNSTLAGALSAAKLHIPVGHVEAGLRSFDRRMPEEVNRVLTDHLARWLFCPSEAAAGNLAREGVRRGVHVVGDVMFGVFTEHLEAARARPLPVADLRPGSYALATVHRADNTDDAARLGGILRAFRALGAAGLPVVLPLHPRTAKAARDARLDLEGTRVTGPLPYDDLLALLARARLVLTDSGGLQKEAAWAGVPCVVLRDTTEWTELIENGWATLAGADERRIVAAAQRARPGKAMLAPSRDAAQRIVEVLVEEGKETPR